MPIFSMWHLLNRPWLGKRLRRRVPYAVELLQKSQVNFAKIKRRRR